MIMFQFKLLYNITVIQGDTSYTFRFLGVFIAEDQYSYKLHQVDNRESLMSYLKSLNNKRLHDLASHLNLLEPV